MSATAAEFAARIWIHRLGSLAAILVVSRSPCPASAERGVVAVDSRLASSVATTCGTWETSATLRSWSSAAMPTGTAPRSSARSSMTPTCAAGVRVVWW